MKKTFIAALCALSLSSSAQDKPVYQFTPIKNMATAGTEDQCATGTCWSFATISFLESEIIRKGKMPIDLSEMYNVRYTYPDKAQSYIRYQGKQQFGPGGLSHDAITVMAEHGIVPEAAYPGLKPGRTEHDHGPLDAMLEGFVKTVLEKSLFKDGIEWFEAFNAILDQYLGKVPTSFMYEGKQYTPESFRDAMGLKEEDYVTITSFTHHPFYTKFALEVPDNWAKGQMYNLPLDEFQKTVDNAINGGYTLAWDADVSEKTFSFKNGLAIWPASNVNKDDYFKKAVSEVSVTQDLRQVGFEKQETTDDHLMHITGTAKDQNGNMYYSIKNSWGTENPYRGYQYISSAYFRMKTISVTVHKDAIPQEIRTKLGL
jgi:bleomycin hydrolase